MGDVRFVQNAPKLIFRDAWRDALANPLNGDVAHIHGKPQALSFFRRLNGARPLD